MTDEQEAPLGVSDLIKTAMDSFSESAHAVLEGKPQPIIPDKFYSNVGLAVALTVAGSLYASTLASAKATASEHVPSLEILPDGSAAISPQFGKMFNTYLADREASAADDDTPFLNVVEAVRNIPEADKPDVLLSAFAMGGTVYLAFMTVVSTQVESTQDDE